MKKTYITPNAEKIEFCYSQQVVASGNCHNVNTYKHNDAGTCTENYLGTEQVPG